MKQYTVLHLFGGVGGFALGFQKARQEYRGMLGQFRTLAGIDCDPEACQDFRNLTESPAVQMDIFTREDYILFHEQEPPEGWQEATPGDLLDASGLDYPDVVALSPPCKGFSGLLPSEKSKSEKYQALNRLVTRGLQLVLDAYADDLPAVIMIENVPRITSRGEFLLKQVKLLLGRHGYVFHEGTHDCGQLGGLGQHRKRYLLIARNEEKMPSFIYHPPIQKLKTIGDVIGPLPMPDDPSMGPMHRLPRLQWKTWVRLALIPAGGDWRDLESCGQYQIEYIPRDGGWQIAGWDETAGAVVGSARVGHSNGVAAISDPRLPERDSRHPGVYQVQKMDDPSVCVTGTKFGSGAPAIADTRTPFNHVFRVIKWDEPSNTVTGANRPNNGAITVADPRVKAGQYPGGYGVIDWDDPSPTVRSAGRVVNAPISVADPRLNNRDNRRNNSYMVRPWEGAAHTITGEDTLGSGAQSIADPRLGCNPRSGTMAVQKWDEPGKTIIGAGDIHAGAAAVADPRIPADNERPDPPPIIIALDGTWHRPLTTLELAALQGFPLTMADGRPLQLVGNSDARWRERIGNAVPPPTAQAIGEEILTALMASEKNEWMLSSTGVWVINDTPAIGEIVCKQ